MIVPVSLLVVNVWPAFTLSVDLLPILIDKTFPIKEVDLVERYRVVPKNQDGAQAVGGIGRSV